MAATPVLSGNVGTFPSIAVLTQVYQPSMYSGRTARIDDPSGSYMVYCNGTSWSSVSDAGKIPGSAAYGTMVLPDGTSGLLDAITSPLQIPNCELWLRAANGAVKADWTACADGDAVTTWLDASGNARHATVASGTPTYRATGGYRGKPGIGGGKMQTTAFVTSGMGAAFTTIIVSRATTGTGLRIKVGIGGSCYFGYNFTNAQRDLSLPGATPNGSSVGVLAPDGLDIVGVSASEQRVFMGGAGITASSSNSTMVRSASGAVTFANNAVTIGGFAGSTTFDWPDSMSEVLFFSRYLTASEIRRLISCIVRYYESMPLVLTLGNSLFAGSSSTGGATQEPRPGGTNIPSLLLTNLAGQVRVLTDCYPGRTGVQIIAEAPAYSGLVSAPLPRTIAAVWEGTNDNVGTGSPQKAFDDIRLICQQNRSGIWKRAIAMTVMKRGDTGNDARNAASTAQLNALISANWRDFADDFVDVAADVRLSDFNNATYFDTDKTHLKDAGYAVVESLLRPAIVRQLTAA